MDLQLTDGEDVVVVARMDGWTISFGLKGYRKEEGPAFLSPQRESPRFVEKLGFQFLSMARRIVSLNHTHSLRRAWDIAEAIIVETKLRNANESCELQKSGLSWLEGLIFHCPSSSPSQQQQQIMISKRPKTLAFVGAWGVKNVPTDLRLRPIS